MMKWKNISDCLSATRLLRATLLRSTRAHSAAKTRFTLLSMSRMSSGYMQPSPSSSQTQKSSFSFFS